VNTTRAATVNTTKAKPVNTDKVTETDAVNMIREAVNSGEVSVRGLARATGWSVGWVSGQIADIRGDDRQDADTAAAEDEQVPA
jgi:hypothetical protein